MQTLETTTNSALFSRKSKIIWKPNLDLNIGMSGLSNITLDQANQNTYAFAHITMEDYILQGVILSIVLLLLLFLYICFWKWVAQVILFNSKNTNQADILRETLIYQNLVGAHSLFLPAFQIDLVRRFDLQFLFYYIYFRFC